MEKSSLNETNRNELYGPNAFLKIKKRLYLMPLWSSIIIGDWAQSIGKKIGFQGRRLTNNPVESYFKHLKVDMLQKRPQSCSELMVAL
jgi:hypothetical protein